MARLCKYSRRLLQFYCLTSVLASSAVLNQPKPLSTLILLSEVQTQSVANETNLTVEEVLRLIRAGFSEELVVTKIKKNGKAFDLSTDELVELKKQGVSEAIIRVLLDPTQPYTPTPLPSAAASAVAAKKYPNDALAIAVPAEPGLYVFNAKVPDKSDLKTLLGMRKGKMLKGKETAYLAGPAAKLRVKAGRSVFYLRLPEGKEISDVILISLLEKQDRRELDGLPGSKGGLNADNVMPFDQLEVGAKLFKVTPPSLEGGEYLFFLVGSAEPEKGSYGKAYDLGVDAAPTPAKK